MDFPYAIVEKEICCMQFNENGHVHQRSLMAGESHLVLILAEYGCRYVEDQTNMVSSRPVNHGYCKMPINIPAKPREPNVNRRQTGGERQLRQQISPKTKNPEDRSFYTSNSSAACMYAKIADRAGSTGVQER